MIWQTKTLASFIAATVEFEGENLLLAEAMNIGNPVADEGTEKRTAASEPNEGSFENFMQTFGSPSRWAGSN